MVWTGLLAWLGGPLAADDFPVYEPDGIPKAEYARRRQAVREAMGPGTIALFLNNPVRNRNNDVDFRYRSDANFYYLTGCLEPDAALLLAPDGITVNGRLVKEVLLVNRRNPTDEIWTGVRMGPERAPLVLGIESAVANSDMSAVLKGITAKSVCPTPRPAALTGQVRSISEAFDAGVSSLGAGRALGPVLSRLRYVKSEAEIRLLRHAVNATVDGHREMLRACRPGMRESQLGAVGVYAFFRAGCQDIGYPNIVGSGPNSCILHYDWNRRVMQAGDVVCIDMGGEYLGYTADITRSFPVNGKFTAPQREIYEIVLAALDAGIAACRPGRPFNAAGPAARDVIAKGLVRLGIIANESESRRYFMHGTSHTIGLDVHDTQPPEPLMPGVVLTVEPGIYIPAGSPCDQKYWNIGIRIEDNVLITAAGPVNLSAGLARTVAEIERTMAQPGMEMPPARAERGR